MGPKSALLLLVLHLILQRSALTHMCKIGYAKEGKDCVDVDECEQELCGEHAVCKNTLGSYYCVCERGFSSRVDNFTATTGQCVDINECGGGNSPCPDSHMICVNTMGSYRCECPTGFTAGRGDGNCVDINECNRDPHICGQGGSCQNSVGGYSCTCDRGYSNFGNKQTRCTKLTCDQFNPDSDQTLTQSMPGLQKLKALMKKNCLSLSTPGEEHLTGQALMENVFTATDEMLSGGILGNGRRVSMLLGTVESAMRLIGPQLNDPISKMETDHTEAELAVRKARTPPTGRVILSTENAELQANWEIASGNQSYPGFAMAALIMYKDLESSANSSFDKLNKGSEEEEETNISYQINSKVVTACVSNPDTKNLPEPVTLTFKHLEDRVESAEMNYTCVYWDESTPEGSWSTQGCFRASSNATYTVCRCNHLSSFAVLMALYPVPDSFELRMITWVGLSLSLGCLFLCIMTFSFCRPIQGTRNTIHLHLCVCLFIADLVFLCGITSTHNPGGCAVVAGLLHFFFLAAFCWMLLEGVQLYRMLVLVFNTTLKPLYMVAVGYGTPLIIVIISALAYPQGYGSKRNCWLSLERGFIWSFFGPVCMIVIINSVFFLMTVWKLAAKFSSLNPDMSKLHKIRGFTVTAIAQLCVLGGMWVFGCFLFQEEGTVVMLYLFTLLNSLQGALIFIMHCLLSKTVREEYSKLLGNICTAQKKRYSEFSTNQTSNSQQPLRSAPSTGESQI
ncbi:CD97 antigen-like isoform X2 [Chanos chanos]|uniref:CD97 antigen-like isoform X2 n=1 Tax=Chanos chanos TaxID=29144 RepID=A0A6J2VUQ1_CHACN|nr:CD97 antigen-like isoform X2 [Chanos chanos]